MLHIQLGFFVAMNELCAWLEATSLVPTLMDVISPSVEAAPFRT